MAGSVGWGGSRYVWIEDQRRSQATKLHAGPLPRCSLKPFPSHPHATISSHKTVQITQKLGTTVPGRSRELGTRHTHPVAKHQKLTKSDSKLNVADGWPPGLSEALGRRAGGGSELGRSLSSSSGSPPPASSSRLSRSRTPLRYLPRPGNPPAPPRVHRRHKRPPPEAHSSAAPSAGRSDRAPRL